MSEPFQFIAGSRSPKIVFVGEAWGEHEERLGQPFVGQSGREFARMLGEAWESSSLVAAANERSESEWLAQRENWLLERKVMLTNVFALRPTGNNLANLCAPKAELPSDYSLPPVRTQSPGYVKPEHLGELTRLKAELEQAAPNLVVALGGTASWALLSRSGIAGIRGSVAHSTLVANLKVLPSYHPAGVLYQWALRGTFIADMLKAKNEADHGHIERPKRQVIVNPDLELLTELVPRIVRTARLLSVDIETDRGQIRCIGFAWARDQSLVIPFIRDRLGNHYWSNEEDELFAWHCARQLLESDVPKLFQNGLFDLQYLIRAGIRTKNCKHDTMLLHHVLYPELPKGLGFLGSVYCNEQSWKMMRKFGEDFKRDE